MITQHHGESPAAQPGRLVWLRRPGAPRKIIYVVAVVVVAAAAAIVVSLAGGQAKKVAGPPPLAKNFALAQLGHPGDTVALTAYAGHPVIVNFFASWCAPCQRETPLIARFYRAEHGRVTVLGVDVNDSSSAALAFVHKTGVGYPVLADPAPMAATLAYGVVALPQTFFLNAQHRIVKRVISAVTLTDLRTGVALLTSQSKRS